MTTLAEYLIVLIATMIIIGNVIGMIKDHARRQEMAAKLREQRQQRRKTP